MSNHVTSPDDSGDDLANVSTHLKAIQKRLDSSSSLDSENATTLDQPLKLQPPLDPSGDNAFSYRSEKSAQIKSQFQNILNQIGQATMDSTSLSHRSRPSDSDIDPVCIYCLSFLPFFSFKKNPNHSA
jgi:hypothetical protein